MSLRGVCMEWHSQFVLVDEQEPMLGKEFIDNVIQCTG